MLEAHRRNNSLLEDLRRRCSTNNWDGLEELGRRHGEKGRWLVGKARERRWLLEGPSSSSSSRSPSPPAGGQAPELIFQISSKSEEHANWEESRTDPFEIRSEDFS